MFTVEFGSDHTQIVALDEGAVHEDVEMYLEEDGTVFIRQWCDDLKEFSLLIISYQQLVDLFASMKSPEGMHVAVVEKV
tara:strand:+ start:12190 stop:12426 length:237 start_codon:yes stop_codon:yes gene_type:complete